LHGGTSTSRSGVAELGQLGLAEWALDGAPHGRGLLAAGTLLNGKYVMGDVLGRGGSSTVHRAHTTATRREVAIKVQRDGAAAEPSMQRRFLREMRLLASIDHPSVLKVFEMGRLPDGQLVAALELFEGPTLRQLLEERGALSPVRALEIAAQLLSVLSAVHDRQLVHRDIKPSHVMVLGDPAGSGASGARRGLRVKLIDFGIARAITPEAKPSSTPAEVLGTPGYLAPERSVLGSPIDARSDLFALGVVLYEMLTGERPFGDTGASLARGIAAGPEPLRRALARRVSPELRALVVSLLAGERDERPASAAIALERIALAPEAVGVERCASSGPPELPSPRVMVISDSKVQRDAWSCAVRGAGGRVIALASLEAAVLLLESAPYPSPTHVLISAVVSAGDEVSLAQLEAIGPDRLAGIIYVEVAALRAYTTTEVRLVIGRSTSVSMPVTEADLRVALAIGG
jgi:serine/threonine protein kinase